MYFIKSVIKDLISKVKIIIDLHKTDKEFLMMAIPSEIALVISVIALIINIMRWC